MGSGSSSHVKNIQLTQNQSNNNVERNEKSTPAKGQRERSAKHRSFRSSKIANETEISENTKTNEQDDKKDRNEKVEELERQLTESESQRLDLEDRVQSLEERLDYYRNQDLLKQEKTCDETLHAKDQYIAKLEKEKTDMEQESNKLKQKSRKKIKMLSSKLSEFKQEANFQMMELREEITKLKEQNLALQEASGDHKQKITPETDETDHTAGGGKMKLILELSAEVAEQNDKITKLERKLKDKNQIIDELRVKLKNNMEYLKARDEVDNQKSATNDKNNNNNQSVSRNYTNGRKTADSGRKSADSAIKISKSSRNNIDSLFSLNEEKSDEDFDDEDKMNKLTALLHGVKAKNDPLRHSSDSLEDEKVCDREGMRGSEADMRKFSGTSRDSGLGSAGKQRKTIENTGKMISSHAQKEPSFSLESGLSDSDLDELGSNIGSHSQITSAPPQLERNTTGRRLKKRSSLKRRISQKNKTAEKPNIPKPSLAFVNTDHRLGDDENIFQIPGSSSLSSVQVS